MLNADALAQTLADARERGVQARPAWPDPAPSLADAYAVQRAANAIYMDASAGWKCGATNEGAQRAQGLDGPFIGPIPKRDMRGDGASVMLTETIGAVEPEIAFRLGRDLSGDVSADEAADAVAACHLALEVIGRRVVGSGFDRGLGLVMDFAGNAVFVVGPAVADWRAQDWTAVPVEGMRDGAVVETGSTANVMGNPLLSLAWAAKRVADEGGSLRAGEWVSTGTCTPAIAAAHGVTVSARFGALGEVSVSFG